MTSKAISTLKVGARPLGIVPQSFEDVQRLAHMGVASGLFKGDRKDTTESLHAKASMAIMHGLEVGVPPMQALQSIAIINGKAVIYGDLLKGILWASGFEIDESMTGEGDKLTCTCTITRPGGKKITRTFSVDQAKKARLWDERPIVKKQWDGKWEEKPNDAPWYKYPDRMLAWRAFGFCCKDGASDTTRGLLIREDVEGESYIDATPDRASSKTKPALLDVPDIPDSPADKAVIDGNIADPSDTVAMIKDAIKEAPEGDVLGVLESYSDLIDSMPMRYREEVKSYAETILKHGR